MSFRGGSVSIQSPKCSSVKLGQTVSSCVSHFMDENGEPVTKCINKYL